MAIGGQNLTLQDYMRRVDPNGGITTIVESLTRECPLLQDAVVKEANMIDGDKFSSRQSLPTVSRRRINRGTPNSKSTVGQTTEPITMLEARSTIDVEEMELNGNDTAFRASEDVAFMEAMTEQAEEAVLYDNKTQNPDEAMGLIHRLDSTTGAAGGQIYKMGAGGSNTNATLLLVGWAENKVYLTFPKGSRGGIVPRPMKEPLPVDDGTNTGSSYLAWQTFWTWKLGISVKDKRYIAAVRNIDMSTIAEGTPASPDNSLIRASIHALHFIKRPSAARMVWYAPRLLHTYLHLQALSSVTHSTLTIKDVGGEPVVMLHGFPVRIADQMTTTEAAIT